MNDIEKEIRLKNFVKERVRQSLIAVGRKIVEEKGADFLTARKLSEASNCSVGTIYNQFANMDNFIMQQNILTLQNLKSDMDKIILEANAYNNLNRLIEVMITFILNNRNLWTLLFNHHMKMSGKLSFSYRKTMSGIILKCANEYGKIVPNLGSVEKKLTWQVLWSALFAMTALLISEGFDKLSQIKQKSALLLLLNTYLAGLKVLKRK